MIEHLRMKISWAQIEQSTYKSDVSDKNNIKRIHLLIIRESGVVIVCSWENEEEAGKRTSFQANQNLTA